MKLNWLRNNFKRLNSLSIKEIQIETTLRFQLTIIRMAKMEETCKFYASDLQREMFVPYSEVRYNHDGNHYGDSSKS